MREILIREFLSRAPKMCTLDARFPGELHSGKVSGSRAFRQSPTADGPIIFVCPSKRILFQSYDRHNRAALGQADRPRRVRPIALRTFSRIKLKKKKTIVFQLRRRTERLADGAKRTTVTRLACRFDGTFVRYDEMKLTRVAIRYCVLNG